MNTIDIYCVNTGTKKSYPLGITLSEIKDDFQVKLDQLNLEEAV